MPNASLGQGLLSSPRQLAGEQGVIAMPEQAIEMEECKQQFQEQIDKLKSRLNAESQLKESYYIEL